MDYNVFSTLLRQYQWPCDFLYEKRIDIAKAQSTYVTYDGDGWSRF